MSSESPVLQVPLPIVTGHASEGCGSSIGCLMCLSPAVLKGLYMRMHATTWHTVADMHMACNHMAHAHRMQPHGVG